MKLQQRTKITLQRVQIVRQILEQLNIEPTAYKVAKISGIKISTLKNKKMKVGEIYQNMSYVPQSYRLLCLGKLGHIYNTPPTNILYWYPIWSLSFYSPMELLLIKDRVFSNQSLYGSDGLFSIDITDPFHVLQTLLVDKLVEYKFFSKLSNTSKLSTLSKNLLNIISQSKRGDGYVPSSSHSLRYLLDYDQGLDLIGGTKKDNCILYRTSNYVSSLGVVKYKYFLSRLGSIIFKEILSLYTELPLPKVDFLDGDILLPKSELTNAEDYDLIILLSSIVGVNGDDFVCRKEVVDNDIGRPYGLQVYLTSTKRKRLIANEADVGACLQSTVAGVLSANGIDIKVEFPAHYEMVIDRSSFRTKLASEVGRPIATIKEWLTVIDNGGHPRGLTKAITVSPSLKAYYEETRPFVDLYMELEHDYIYERAKRVSKRYDLSKLREKATKGGWTFNEDNFTEAGIKVFGLFFNMWTQRERTLREFAKGYCKGYAYDIHDAIGSNSHIDIAGINEGIKTLGEEYKYIRFE